MGDTGNALLAAVAIVGALYHRDRTGEGQFVSTAIVNAGLLHTGYAYLHADGTPAQWGHVDAGQYGLSPTYRLFRCAGDEWVAIAAVTDHQRQRLTGLVPGDVEEWCSGRRAGEVVAALDAAGVPGEVVNESFCRELFADPEAERLGWVSRTSAGGVGRFEDPGLLIDFSATPGGVQRGPCLCGFWDAADEGRLVIQRCATCARWQHPPRPMCPECGSLDQAWAEVSGGGVVYSCSVLHHPQHPAFDYPVVAALVDLDEGVRLVSTVVGVDAGLVRIGQRVHVRFAPTTAGGQIPVFAPEGRT